jgi:heterodisulfide reductase subunit A-like polyferredoxin
MNARRKKVERRRSVVVVDKSWFELESANRRVLFQLFENGFTKEKVRRLETIGRRIRALPQFLGTMVLSEYLARPAKERRRAALVLDEEYEGLLYEVVEKLESIIRSGNSRAVSGSAIAGIVSGPMTVGVSVPAPKSMGVAAQRATVVVGQSTSRWTGQASRR